MIGQAYRLVQVITDVMVIVTRGDYVRGVAVVKPGVEKSRESLKKSNPPSLPTKDHT